MAIVWEKTERGVHYQVRSAGHTRRLYTDGVFHSQYHPRRAFIGGIWDLLFLPALFAAPGRIRRVLLLGVGGGAVIHQLQRFIQPRTIIGVELNPVHLQVARRHFGITPQLATLEQADAVQWLADYRGPAFDMIIDDLFGEAQGEPVRAVDADVPWCRQLLRHLSPDGLLVMNFIGSRDLRRSACLSHPPLAARFESVFQFSLPGYENAIGAFLRRPAEAATLRRELARRGAGSKCPAYRLRRLV